MSSLAAAEKSTDFSQVSQAINHNSKLISNWEKKIRHEELVKHGKAHAYGVSKRPWGREFYLVEENKVGFIEGLRHPSKSIARFIEVIKTLWNRFLEALHINISVQKNAALVNDLEQKVQADVDSLPSNYQRLKQFAETLSGQQRQTGHVLQETHDALVAELDTARGRIKNLENSGSEHLHAELAHLRASFDQVSQRKSELEQKFTRQAQVLEERDRRIVLLKNTKSALEKKIQELSDHASALEQNAKQATTDAGKHIKETMQHVAEEVKSHLPHHHHSHPAPETQTQPSTENDTSLDAQPVEAQETASTKVKEKKKKHGNHSQPAVDAVEASSEDNPQAATDQSPSASTATLEKQKKKRKSVLNLFSHHTHDDAHSTKKKKQQDPVAV